MKSILVTLLCFLAMAATTQAKVIIVNNNNPSPSQYSSLQTALDSAANGDTIYVQGSATHYGNPSITKRVVLFGAGYKPNKTNNLPSKLNIVTIDSTTTGASGSGTVIMGFEITEFTSVNSFPLYNLLIKRNRFIKNPAYNFGGLTINGVNCTVEQNIFDSSSVCELSLGSATGCLIRNNIVGCQVRNITSTAVLINNIFIGSGNAFLSVSNALVANNIFYGAAPQGCSNASFYNNITYQTSNNTLPYGSNTGSGNLAATNPLFTSATQYAFDYSQDYNLQATSPGKATGTDLTDIGLYGGGAPMPAYGGEPPIPQMKQFSVSPVVKKNGNLQIQFKAQKQD